MAARDPALDDDELAEMAYDLACALDALRYASDDQLRQAAGRLLPRERRLIERLAAAAASSA